MNTSQRGDDLSKFSDRFKERMAEANLKAEAKKQARDEERPQEEAAHALAQSNKKAAQDHAALEKYGLNLDEYDQKTIKQKNIDNIRRLAQDLLGNNFIKFGMALSFGKVEEQAKITYLSALVEQNWILIRQQEQVIKLLERLTNNIAENS